MPGDDAKAILIWEEVMPKLVGFSRFAALLEEQISEKISRRILSGDQGMVVWWSIGAGVHVEPHTHTNEEIVWMLKVEAHVVLPIRKMKRRM